VKTKTQRHNNKNIQPQVVEKGMDYNANEDQDTADGDSNSTLPLDTHCDLDAKGCAGCSPSQCKKTDKCILNAYNDICSEKCKNVKDCMAIMPGHEEGDLKCYHQIGGLCAFVKPCDLNTTDCESCELNRCRYTAGCRIANTGHDWERDGKPKCFSSSCTNDKECQQRTGKAHYVCLKGECQYAECDPEAKGCSGCTPYQCEMMKMKDDRRCRINHLSGKCDTGMCKSVNECMALSPGFKEEDFACDEYGLCENVKPCKDCESCEKLSRCENTDGCMVAGVSEDKDKCISSSCDNDKECQRKTGTADVICLKGECEYEGCRKDADCLALEHYASANATLEDVFCNDHYCEEKGCDLDAKGCAGCTPFQCGRTHRCVESKNTDKCIAGCESVKDCVALMPGHEEGDLFCNKYGECEKKCRKDADCLAHDDFLWTNPKLEDVFCHNSTCKAKACNEGCPGCSLLRCSMSDECFHVEGEQEKCISNACKTSEDCRKKYNDDDDDLKCLNGLCAYDDDYGDYDSDEDHSDDDNDDDDHSEDE